MKRFERLAWVTVAGMVCNVMAWATIEGCGPDNSTDAGDGSPDQTTDVGQDVAPDVKADAGPDVIVEAGPDVAEIIAFQQQYAAELCKRLGSCCYGTELDAAAPDAAVASCIAYTTSAFGGGLENAIGDLARGGVIQNGNIVVNETAKASCLAGLATMSCPSITGTEYDTLTQNCIGALTGTLAVGHACNATIECNNGFCNRPDAGAGSCVALSTIGQACSSNGNGNDQCMYRSWLGSQQARCDNGETEAGTCGAFGTATSKCVAKTATGGGCFLEWECASNNCNETCTCIPNTSTWSFVAAGVCPVYFGADAGL